MPNAKYLAFGTSNTTFQASWGIPNLLKFCNMLQYCLKYETVQTQMLKQNSNFLFNLFSLLSIFNSMFSLSSHWFVSLLPMFSLSFFFKSPSLTLKSTVRRPYRSRCRPHRSSCDHRFSFEDSITINLKTPLSPVWSRHCHLSLKLPCRLDLNPSQPRLEVVAPLV